MDSEKISRKGKSRGLGSVYPRGNVWWIEYHRDGERIRESSAQDGRAGARTDAVSLLRNRIKQAESGKPTGPAVEKTTLADLARMLETEYAANGRASSAIKAPLAHLLDHFGADCRAVAITTDKITSYVTARQGEGSANATINRSLAALKRAFRLAERAGRVANCPYIPMLREDNARSGFLSHDEFLRLRGALPEDLRDPVGFLYASGWRVSEMRALEWRDVDLAGSVVRLRPELSKNGKGRVLPLRGELASIIERAQARRIPSTPFVFRRDNGEPVGLFRKSWASACRAAGLGAILVHDLRRCAIRNLVRAGTPEKVAMELSGHTTRSVFDRYNIVAESDLAHALDRVNDYLATQPQASTPNVIPLDPARRLATAR